MISVNPVVRKIVGNKQLRRDLIDACGRNGEPPLTEQAINEWKKLRRGVPPARVQLVARITGWPPHKIRPDIYPPPKRNAAG